MVNGSINDPVQSLAVGKTDGACDGALPETPVQWRWWSEAKPSARADSHSAEQHVEIPFHTRDGVGIGPAVLLGEAPERRNGLRPSLGMGDRASACWTASASATLTFASTLPALCA
jgi:hypothetical protein